MARGAEAAAADLSTPRDTCCSRTTSPLMREAMSRADLYPPVFLTAPDLSREALVVFLFNEARPSAWDQVEAYLEKHGEIGNEQVRSVLRTDDRVRASKLLKSWVKPGLLVVSNPTAAKQHRRYRRPGGLPEAALFSSTPGNQAGASRKGQG